ncbi:hypothetical protein [Alteromonas confluentis]|uniref:Uncharacterized protein n=1 Tax=Alteromonas confluentis TaxID=1656094 RepID=A0A1E7ZAK8_9ALTE|nr:hypothetical protein [Alteromonas confluentis]OFC70507.1 hypothetical protein BFC18_12140 [Alteromonas confluentis]
MFHLTYKLYMPDDFHNGFNDTDDEAAFDAYRQAMVEDIAAINGVQNLQDNGDQIEFDYISDGNSFAQNCHSLASKMFNQVRISQVIK